ncbi:MAG TPA: hypothetical protein VHL98_11090 [Microvirga sp.]|jgi:hypothetical protein|nr:hypothetical protein [Microvirga sp.]
MKTVVISEAFTGYPNGKRRSFAKGEEVEIAVAYADLLIEKGHAREKPSPAPAEAPASVVEPSAQKPKR